MKTYTAGGAIAHRRIVKFGAADGAVLQATAATEGLIGVTDHPGGAASGERVDVVRSGFTEVEFGGTVTRGGYVTADVDGKAVAAAPAAGTNNGVVGRAEVSAVAGDIALVFILPAQVQG
ncbi:DUF2190 domain-containing protein [Oleomonas cavernae]|uniref:DUF2190 domain-containing protein n=1 Tax=Oleomonas cavernae TaxID=2320859 RepID=UPI001F40F84B|nr:DUF2190 domain-containing protein [Oleomonas cavernae]